jgi:hypothetical protein
MAVLCSESIVVIKLLNVLCLSKQSMFKGDRRCITRAEEKATDSNFESDEPSTHPHAMCYHNRFQFIFV